MLPAGVGDANVDEDESTDSVDESTGSVDETTSDDDMFGWGHSDSEDGLGPDGAGDYDSLQYADLERD